MESSPLPCPRRPAATWLYALALLAQLTLAQHAPVPLPAVIGPIAVTDTSFPQMSAARMQTVVDLAASGYVEEEFFVSGTANVYGWPEAGTLAILTTGAPYTTRILVRRPADPALKLYNPERYAALAFANPVAGLSL